MMASCANIHEDLPLEVLIQVLTYLDVKSICSCLRVSKAFHRTIEEKLWKNLSIRDHYYFLATKPLTKEELEFPTQGSQIKTEYESEQEANMLITNPFKNPPTPSEISIFEETIGKISNWKQFYIDCFKLPNLSGFWVGDYGGHGHELIRIYHKGYKVYAKKLTGDPNVPAGKITWRMTLGKNLLEGKGDIHLADTGFQNSRWSTAYLKVDNERSVQITWFIEYYMGVWYSLTFGTVKAGYQDNRPFGLYDRIRPLIDFEME